MLPSAAGGGASAWLEFGDGAILLTRSAQRACTGLTPLAAAIAVAFAAHAAAAAPIRFVGPHPVAERAGGGYCAIEAPHLHSYVPDHSIFYHPTPTGFAFIGDPTPFGYTGERHVFYGHHPVACGAESVFCFIDGPHHHAFAPPGGDDYDVVDGIAFYVGPLAAAYVDERAKRWQATNDAFVPFARFRPAVKVVVPPPEWKGRLYTPPGVKVQLPSRPKHVRRTRVRVEVQQ
jgi:hypothetical protein